MADLYRALETPPPLRDQVYYALEELILEGRLSAGDRLIESDLAAQLRVSRGPIREALQLLERDGWLEVRPRRGTYVRATGEEELDDYFRARSLLEVQACRLAARRSQQEPGALEELERRLERSRELSAQLLDDEPDVDGSAARERRRRYRENSRHLHRLIAELSGNPGLAELIEYTTRRTRWYFGSAPAKDRQARQHEHRRILDAIRDGEEQLAADRMSDHLDQLRSDAIAMLRRERSGS